ncbi:MULTISPECIES: C40 family peptidase [unclassified Streptomyces]|uniref:C40 family peptidase n=1 Tax=Streptomyces sp. SID8354 TaxID=2690339 RepID=UPI00036679F6|nr:MULTISPECIES: C40 family peptidase [unclassified Streptomyces]
MASHHTAGERPPLVPPPALARTGRSTRSGLLLVADPQRYLDGATVLERTGSHQATAVAGWARRLGSVRRVGSRPTTTTDRPPDPTAPGLPEQAGPHAGGRSGPRGPEQPGSGGSGQAGSLGPGQPGSRALEPSGSRPPEQAAAAPYAAECSAPRIPESAATVAAPAPSALPAPAPGERAAQAVAFAHAALGKPYAWGATGPAAYDCSGLTLAAWKAAGVTLPRTTYTQITSGARVTWPHLAPGDLVFFYSGISHVGLYIGGGEMIHAPHPGVPVQIAPLDQLPFAGATRPA